MKIRKSGIFKTIDSKDFGYWQAQGFEKVIEEVLPKLEEVKVEPEIKDEPIKEVVQDEPIEEIVDEMPKSKKNRRK
jgi:hypothetical protein